MGIDPASIRNLGVAMVKFDTNTREIQVVEHTTEILPDFDTDGGRLAYIHGIMKRYHDRYDYKVLAVERSTGFGQSFVRQNLQESAGVMKLFCHNNKVKVNEVAPTHIKLMITGDGKAPKAVVIQSVMDYTGMAKSKTEHEADAVATAIVYLVDEGLLPEIHEGTYRTRESIIADKEKVKARKKAKTAAKRAATKEAKLKAKAEGK
jgi:Holliday junction resolvasome RuvABC endonuclease subunit